MISFLTFKFTSILNKIHIGRNLWTMELNLYLLFYNNKQTTTTEYLCYLNV